MGLVKRLPRRALVASMLGALYGLLVLPDPRPESLLGINAVGVAWFALSLALLFLTPLAYHAFSLWAILWVAWKGVEAFQAYPGHLGLVLDVGMPAVAFLLLLTSGYLMAAREAKASS